MFSLACKCHLYCPYRVSRSESDPGFSPRPLGRLVDYTGPFSKKIYIFSGIRVEIPTSRRNFKTYETKLNLLHGQFYIQDLLIPSRALKVLIELFVFLFLDIAIFRYLSFLEQQLPHRLTIVSRFLLEAFFPTFILLLIMSSCTASLTPA